MNRKIIDLSATIAPSKEDAPMFAKVGLKYYSHSEGADFAKKVMNVGAEYFKDSEAWASEEFTNLGTHKVTHVDAPWHYNSTINGKKSETIDQLPLEWFFNDGVMLDMRNKKKGDPITPGDIEAELSRIRYPLKPLDIVLICTGCDKFYFHHDYIHMGPGVTAESTIWLYEQGIRVMGIDMWSWDEPLDIQKQKVLEENKKGIIWAAHQVGLSYAHMERLINLDKLPPSGFQVACFPLRIKDGSAGPTRAVAIVEQ